MNISKVLQSSGVGRFHAAPGLSSQTIAQHSWGVTMLCQYFDPECRKELVLAALTHDCTEAVTGDIPATAKWQSPELKTVLDEIEAKVEKEWGIHFELTEQEQRLLKLCDGLEGMNYCLERRRHGEMEASVVFYRWADFIMGKFMLNDTETEFLSELITKMGNLTNGS